MRHLLQTTFKSANLKSMLQESKIRKFVNGEFPQALNYSRPFFLSKLDNGITVASEIMPTKISSISVFIKCGSRNQTQESSGTAHFLQHLHFKGTTKRTREQLELEVEDIGGNLNAYTSRQNTCYMMSVFDHQLDQAVDIVGDMITNSLYRKPDVENERGTIHRQLIETQKSAPLETTIEMAHKGVYQNHQMGLPILGYIQNMQTISRQMIDEYHRNNYVGQNIIVIASGPINHNELIESVQRHMKVQKQSKTKKSELIKPKFSAGMSCLQSHLTKMVNMVTISQAPSFFQNQFFSYLLLQRILADRPQTPLEIEIMKNSNSFRFQKHLAQYNFIEKQKGFYSSYWDTGLYGNYYLIDPQHSEAVIKLTLEGYSMYANKITDEELERAKRRVYVQILQHESQNDITQSIGNNLMYYDRRVTTKQLAERVSCVTAEQLQAVASKIVDNPDKMHVAFWGNTKKVNILKQMYN